MGSLSLDFFCENGHHVFNIPHGYEVNKNNIKLQKCDVCKSKNIKSVMEWQDPDYECGKIVSFTPKTFDTIHIPAHDEKIPVYDVSKLFDIKGRKLIK
jgi:hypothetical protein